MDTVIHNRGRGFLAFAYYLTALSCVVGMLFCVIKSPQAKSAAYQSLAASALAEDRHEDALAAAMEAAQLDPYSVHAWKILSLSLKENGRPSAATEAEKIAARLDNPRLAAVPAYASPAELKLSFIADLDGAAN